MERIPPSIPCKSLDSDMDAIDLEIPKKPSSDSTLKRILQNESYADLFLQAGNNKMKVHSFFLAEQSPVFKNLIINNKSKTNTVAITDVTFSQLQAIIKFLYEDSIESVREKAEELLPAARKYKLDRLTKICENTLCKKINVQNSLRILKIAVYCPKLLDPFYAYVVKFINR